MTVDADPARATIVARKDGIPPLEIDWVYRRLREQARSHS
jgi:hypothetical protein